MVMLNPIEDVEWKYNIKVYKVYILVWVASKILRENVANILVFGLR